MESFYISKALEELVSYEFLRNLQDMSWKERHEYITHLLTLRRKMGNREIPPCSFAEERLIYELQNLTGIDIGFCKFLKVGVDIKDRDIECRLEGRSLRYLCWGDVRNSCKTYQRYV